MTSILVHYSELALKGKNRPWFIHRLVRNLHAALAGLHVKEVRTPIGRIEIVLGQESAMAEVRERLSRVFGIANYSEAMHVPLDFDGMAEAIVSQLPPKESATTFRVHVRRSDPKFTTPSPELARDLGSKVWYARGWKVDLDHADLVISVEIAPGVAYCYMGREAGPGGLPTGTAGRVVALLSGGIDSPVAAWRMMKRGCHVTLVHFHSTPFLSNASQAKARQLAEVLTRYQLRSRLYLVPFGELQRQVTLSVPGDLRVIVYRRLMLRIAQRIARDVRARALVTGDVIGQVASQTLDNMTVIDRASPHDHPPAAGRHGQGGDHHAGAAARHLRHLHPARPGFVHAVHAAPSGNPRASLDGGRGGENAADRRHGGSAVKEAAVEHLSFPVVK